jgi:CheY-like chemotaxis protein
MTQKDVEDRSWSVVLAEDNDDHALLIQMALDRAAQGAVSVRRARNGSEAVELVRASVPDLLLLDLKMPGLAGHEVLESLKSDSRTKRVPVAVLTSSDRDEDMAKAYGLGGNHFITKPESPAELEQRLRTLLKNLAELGDIRRGSAGMSTTAVSAVDPQAMNLRNLLSWTLSVLVVIVLLLFAFFSGAF